MRNLGLIGLFALGLAGCSSSTNGNNGSPDMATTGPGGCVSATPASDTDFLNACTTADSYDVTPFYPANAPNGALPALP
jgi:hypothetical protein